MSRYEFRPSGWPPHCSLVVGWDDPLGTFFGLVIDTTTGPDEAGVIASFGGTPPHFHDLDNLVRIVNAGIKGRLPPVQLTAELRRSLRKDAKAKRPVVNAITLAPSGQRAPAGAPNPAARPCLMLGSGAAYLEADELREVLDGMADQFFRLEELYRAKKAAGLSEAGDEGTRRVRDSLGKMEIVCSILAPMVQTPGILVAADALQPFYGFAAEAGRVLQSEAASPAGTVH